MPNKQEVWIIKTAAGYWGKGQRWVKDIDDAIYYFSHGSRVCSYNNFHSASRAMLGNY